MKNLNRNQILTNVQRDIKQRINDWVRSGGSLEDPYVRRQKDYLYEITNKINQEC